MVRIITVEREYGSRAASSPIGWPIIWVGASSTTASWTRSPRKIGLDKAAVANCDERLDPWYYRLGKTFWHASVERMPAIMSSSEVFDAERMTSLIRDYLKDRVAEGNCVVVGTRRGFGADQCSGDIPCLRLCLDGAEDGMVPRPVP